MAILKHMTSKNSNYNDALFYLLFEHQENTMKPVLDENGKMIRRRGYIIEGMNCEPFTYAEECQELNEQYHKNQTPGEIKAHHYIISFDPQDQVDPGLTPERAQAIGMEYAQKNFPGHQALVFTHADGSHGSGNIHVHIVINSLRKFDIEPQPFCERPCDSRAGYKHHQTRALLTHLQKSVMEICGRENLHQVDLLTPAKKKISEGEYWAQYRGQQKLDKANEEVTTFGLTPAKTTYQTEKQFLRDAIADISKTAKSLEEFQEGLWGKYKIRLTDKRGRFSYLHPNRKKNITDRALGTDYGREYLMRLFGQNRISVQNCTENTEAEKNVPDSQIMPGDSWQSNPAFAGLPPVIFIRSDLRLVVDLQNNIKAQQSRTYAQKVKLSNLQQMAKTIAYVQEHGYDSRNDLQAAYDEVIGKRGDARKTLCATEDKIKSVNERIHYTGQYLAGKSVYGQMLKSRSKKKFRQEHSAEIEQYETAVKFLKAHSSDGKIPSMKSLKSEKESLTIQKKAQQETYGYFKEYAKELRTVCSNVDAILGVTRVQETERAKTYGISEEISEF